MIEACSNCGKQWGVTSTPREIVLCTECASGTRLAEGEIRVDADGTTVVCLGGDSYLRWKVIGVDPSGFVMHGWRADQHVRAWRVAGNVHDPAKTGELAA